MFTFAIIIGFQAVLQQGVKFSTWGKNSVDGVKIHHVGTSETVKRIRSNS